jgi:Domain of unknown function (DUF1840)
MLIKFKSKAAAEILMYKEHARRILDLLGKNPDQGVITAPEIPHVIAVLEKEISESRAHFATDELQRDVMAHHGNDHNDNDHEPAQIISFAARAYPLLEMLRAAQQEQQPVVWGV